MDKKNLYKWCSIPVDKLLGHPDLKTPLRIVKDSAEMGELMAGELISEIELANNEKRVLRAILPCGPYCWYKPFAKMVNEKGVSLHNLVVYHMDECYDWQGLPLPENHPFNLKSEMIKNFYSPIDAGLAVPEQNRRFITIDNVREIAREIAATTIDYTMGGWGQDGHVAYNQARRHPFSSITLEELRNSTARIQENNIDTIIALGQRNFGGAYQFSPPMSVTLGVKECLSAKKVRVFSDTGAWKQTALRVALFSDETAEYPMTLLQNHPDAIITATFDTARHPISEHPEWEFDGVDT